MNCADHAIITPFYNAEAYLPDHVASIAAQTLKPCQWILIDDGSTDDSINQLETALSRHQKELAPVTVEIIQPPQRGGVSKARNLGMERVGAQRVTLHDVDDFYTPNFIARMQYLSEKYNPDMVILGYTLEPSKEVEPVSETLSALKSYLAHLEEDLLSLSNSLEVVTYHDFPLGPGSNVCCKTSFLQQNRYDETTNFFEGLEFWYRSLKEALRTGPCLCLLETGDYLHINMTPNSLSRRRLSYGEASQLPGILTRLSNSKDCYDQRIFNLVLARWFPNVFNRIKSNAHRALFLLRNQTLFWRFLFLRIRQLLETK